MLLRRSWSGASGGAAREASSPNARREDARLERREEELEDLRDGERAERAREPGPRRVAVARRHEERERAARRDEVHLAPFGEPERLRLAGWDEDLALGPDREPRAQGVLLPRPDELGGAPRHLAQRNQLDRLVAAELPLDLALGEALLADRDPDRDADQIGVLELHARALVAVVVEHVEAGRASARTSSSAACLSSARARA